jgi:hypothetical protein
VSAKANKDAGRLLASMYPEARKDPKITFPDAFEHGERLGLKRQDVIDAVEVLTTLGYVRWETNAWVSLTAKGLREGARLKSPPTGEGNPAN